MNEQEKFNRFRKRYPVERPNFFERPHVSRRRFFQTAAAGISGSFLTGRQAWGDSAHGGAATKNTARNVIFILLGGAPSQVDTFDFKMNDGVTPASFAPETVHGIQWPMGLLPKLGGMLPDFAIVRSMQSHALVHRLGVMWTQIGRNPAGPLGNIAPHIGSVVAIEKDGERQPGQSFPTFLALNSDTAVGAGYFAEKYGPFRLTPDTGGIANLAHPGGDARFQKRWNLMHGLDDNLRVNSPDGVAMENYNEFYSAARGLMDSPLVTPTFSFSAADSARYGKSTLGNACLVAYQVLKAQQGTRFIQITSSDGWDMHYGIYAANGLPAKGQLLDNAVSALLGDLKASGMLSSTLVVMLGEFGRTVGPLSPQGGRDHYVQQFAFFAGGGVKGGTVIGATDALGSDVVDFGWSRQRYVYIEDVEATIYSAMGIDWTYVRPDDPIHRGFEYVPFSEENLYGPVHELWG